MGSIPFQAVPVDRATYEALGTKAFGPLNRAQSTHSEIRFGTNGSKSIEPGRGVWFDHETGTGGGYHDLYKLANGHYPENGSDWTNFHVPDSYLRQLGNPVAWWDYCDRDGALIGRVVRFHPPQSAPVKPGEKPPKTFRQCHPDGAGWKWSGNPKFPLYRSPELARTPAGAMVYLTEGEKHADALRAWGLHATTNPGGGGKLRPDHARALTGFKVAILGDNDDAGRKHVSDALHELAMAGVDARVVELPDLPPKGDVLDWIETGGNATELADLTAEAWQARDTDHPPQPSPTALWTAADWEETSIPPRPWIARGYLLRGSVTVVAGAGSAGKSSLMCSYAAALGLGKPCHRMVPTRAYRVLTYNVEDDADEQRRRFSAVLRHMGNRPGDIRGQVAIVGPNQVGTLLTRDAQTGVVIFTPAMAEMIERIEAFRPDVLILDPLIELHGCEENDNTALRAIMATFRTLAVRHDMAVVLLHHTRKGSAGAAGDPDSSRGASSIIGAARIVLTVTSMTDGEAEAFGFSSDQRRYYFRVDGAKSNYAPLEVAEWFERQAFTLDNGDQVAAAVPWEPPADVLTADSRSTIEAAISAGTSGGPYSDKLSGDDRSVKHLFEQHGITTKMRQRNLLAELAARGFLPAEFQRANRGIALGLRAPDGRPANVKWVDGTTIA